MTIAEVLKLAQTLPPRAFGERFNHPMLLHLGSDEENEEVSTGFATNVVDSNNLGRAQGSATQWHDNQAFAVVKSSSGPYEGWISVGRARNSDVRIESPHVSKFHGYFQFAADGWTYTDVGSRNGSWVNGFKLEARTARQLPNDCLMVIGTHVMRFLATSSALSRFLLERD